jgi:hypothetical protein
MLVNLSTYEGSDGINKNVELTSDRCA